jgi:plasmid stability protein
MKSINVHNVPNDLHRALKERAAREGTTMSSLIRRELPRLARRPSPEQLLERISRRDRS